MCTEVSIETGVILAEVFVYDNTRLRQNTILPLTEQEKIEVNDVLYEQYCDVLIQNFGIESCQLQNPVYRPITPKDIFTDAHSRQIIESQPRQMVEFLIVIKGSNLGLVELELNSIHNNIETTKSGFTFKPRLIGKPYQSIMT